MSKTDYYEVLGVPPTASAAQIKRAYRLLALKHHPDRNAGDARSEEIFKSISHAYSVLSDLREKEAYDYNYNYYRNQRHSESKVHRAKASETPPDIIVIQQIVTRSEEIKAWVDRTTGKHRSLESLFTSINELLSDDYIRLLLSHGDIKINRTIIDNLLLATKALPYYYVGKVTIKLARLGGADNDIILKIFKFTRRQKKADYWNRYQGIAVGAIIFTIMVLTIRYGGTDQDSGWAGYDHAAPSENFNEQAEAIFTKSGWSAVPMSNGAIPSCYHAVQQYDTGRRYIQLGVGGGADVLVKVVNVQTGESIRTVFINRGSVLTIRDVPEGFYYLKIAYGTHWFSKVDNDICQGRFMRNNTFVASTVLFNLSGKDSSDVKLQIDASSREVRNSFGTTLITEPEFYR